MIKDDRGCTQVHFEAGKTKIALDITGTRLVIFDEELETNEILKPVNRAVAFYFDDITGIDMLIKVLEQIKSRIGELKNGNNRM